MLNCQVFPGSLISVPLYSSSRHFTFSFFYSSFHLLIFPFLPFSLIIMYAFVSPHSPTQRIRYGCNGYGLAMEGVHDVRRGWERGRATSRMGVLCLLFSSLLHYGIGICWWFRTYGKGIGSATDRWDIYWATKRYLHGSNANLAQNAMSLYLFLSLFCISPDIWNSESL